MKVLVFAAAAAAFFGVSRTEMLIAPDIHPVSDLCDDRIPDAEQPVTSLGAFFCKMQSAMPYDSLHCLFSNIRIGLRRAEVDDAPDADQFPEDI